MVEQREGTTVVLQDDIEHEDFVRVAKNHLGLIPYKTYSFSKENEVFEDVWITPDQLNVVHFIDNPNLHCRYLWVRGSEMPRLISQIYGLLPYLFLEDLISDFNEADNHHEAVDAILKIPAACPNYDPAAFGAFEFCIQDPRTSVRKATIQAIAHRMWPESRPLLEKLIEIEPVKKVRDYAQSVLNKYQSQPV
jgi:hypothetical protein